VGPEQAMPVQRAVMTTAAAHKTLHVDPNLLLAKIG
jgi:hypothetical protein